jgi:hypothetical protein
MSKHDDDAVVLGQSRDERGGAALLLRIGDDLVGERPGSSTSSVRSSCEPGSATVSDTIRMR